MYVEYISIKNGFSDLFNINDPRFQTLYSISKLTKARYLPRFTSIMLRFELDVAAPGPECVLYTVLHGRDARGKHNNGDVQSNPL
jgi:hypothetical protein